MQPVTHAPGMLNQSGMLKTTTHPIPASLVLAPPGELRWKPSNPGEAEIAVPLPSNPRCAERGCVFPAAPDTAGMCLHHYRQIQEPILFASHQPTRAVVERGRFGIPEHEVDTSRLRDRRRLAALREAFLEDEFTR